MKGFKKLWKALTSMWTAVALLVLLAALCALASLVPQGLTAEAYQAQYSPRVAALILATHMDDAFHSWWFLLLTLALCCNLTFCDLRNLPSLLRRTREADSPDAALRGPVSVCFRGLEDPQPVFEKLRLRAREQTLPDGTKLRFARKHRAGLWGAWVCHLGVLLLIVGFALSQMYHWEASVYGTAGQTKPLGDTGLQVTIDSFEVGLREDDTVEQYTAGITVASSTERQSATVRVNEPADLFGLRFYQNSTGWAATVSVRKDGVLQQQEVLCAGEGLAVEDAPQLVVFFNAFYPDYIFEPGTGPATASGQMKNPGFLYSLYYGEELLGMNVLTGDEKITVDSYEISFSEPRSYTVLQVKRDRFAFLALIGSVILLAGLFLAFYLRPQRVWAVREEGGWTLRGFCRKGGVLFREALTEAVGAPPEDPEAPKPTEEEENDDAAG